jgi:hypothetical protein
MVIMPNIRPIKGSVLPISKDIPNETPRHKVTALSFALVSLWLNFIYITSSDEFIDGKFKHIKVLPHSLEYLFRVWNNMVVLKG